MQSQQAVTPPVAMHSFGGGEGAERGLGGGLRCWILTSVLGRVAHMETLKSALAK